MKNKDVINKVLINQGSDKVDGQIVDESGNDELVEGQCKVLTNEYIHLLEDVKAEGWKDEINECLKIQSKADFINSSIYVRGMFFNHSKIQKAEGRIEFVDGKSSGKFVINKELYKLTSFKEDSSKTKQFNLFMGIENLDKKQSLKIEAMQKNNCISGI